MTECVQKLQIKKDSPKISKMFHPKHLRQSHLEKICQHRAIKNLLESILRSYSELTKSIQPQLIFWSPLLLK